MNARVGPHADLVPPSASGLRRERLAWIAIALVAFALRVIAVLQYQARHPNAELLAIDELAYDGLARALASGAGFGDQVFFQEPLYPAWLALVYAFVSPERLVVRLVQACLWTAACIGVGLTARRVFGRAAGFGAAGLFALHAPGLVFPSLLLKENLLVPVLVLFTWLLLRTRNAAGGRRQLVAWASLGALAGIGALLRGNVLVLVPLFALWPFLRCAVFPDGARARGAWPKSAALLAGCALVLAPVALRNWQVGRVLALTTSGTGTNLYAGNNAENPWGRATELRFVRGIPETEAGDWKREAERRTGRVLDAGEVSAYWRDLTFAEARAEPLGQLQRLWNKLRLTLGAYEVPDNHLFAWDRRYVAIARAPWPTFAQLGSLGLAGLLLCWWSFVRKRNLEFVERAAALELSILFALYTATIVLTVTSDRARLPLIVWLAPFAGYALVELARGWRARRATAFVALIAGIAIVHAPTLSAEERAEDLEKRDYNLAVAWSLVPERADEARALAHELAVRHPRSARVALLVQEIDVRAAWSDGRLDEHERSTIEVAAARADAIGADETVFPRERSRAHALAAWIQLRSGRFDEAARAFEAAREFDADARDLRRGHAQALLAAAGARAAPENAASERVAAERAHALLLALLDTQPTPHDLVERGELEVALAQAEFQRARGDLAVGDPARVEAAQQGVRDALERLKRVAGEFKAGSLTRARARELAGWIQLAIGGATAAEGHFRAALSAAGGADRELEARAAAGLLEALFARIETTPAGDERARGVRELGEVLARVAAQLDAQSRARFEERFAQLQRGD